MRGPTCHVPVGDLSMTSVTRLIARVDLTDVAGYEGVPFLLQQSLYGHPSQSWRERTSVTRQPILLGQGYRRSCDPLLVSPNKLSKHLYFNHTYFYVKHIVILQAKPLIPIFYISLWNWVYNNEWWDDISPLPIKLIDFLNSRKLHLFFSYFFWLGWCTFTF